MKSLPLLALLTITGGLVWAMIAIPGRVEIATAAAFALGVGAIAALLGYTLGIVTMLYVNRQHSELEAARFKQNVMENIGIMGKMQGVMNSQNTQLLRQNRELQKTAQSPAAPQPALMIEDGIFAELE